MAAAHRLQQAGHAQRGVGTHFQRVEPVVVHAFEQAVHGLQALQRFEVELLVTHGQVVALHQAQAQITGQIGVLKIGFVVRAGREQRDVGTSACRAAGLDAVDQGAVGLGQTLDRKGLEGLRELARHNLPVFQQIAQTRGRLRALRQQPPAAVRAARQIEGRQRQIAATHGRHAVHGWQISGVALHQRSGQLPIEHQLLRPVGIGHDAFEQLHALHHTRLDLLPVGVSQHERKQVERPRPLRLVRGGIHVVGDAVVAHLALQVGHAGVQLGCARCGGRVLLFNEGEPGGAERGGLFCARAGVCRRRRALN